MLARSPADTSSPAASSTSNVPPAGHDGVVGQPVTLGSSRPGFWLVTAVSATISAPLGNELAEQRMLRLVGGGSDWVCEPTVKLPGVHRLAQSAHCTGWFHQQLESSD